MNSKLTKLELLLLWFKSSSAIDLYAFFKRMVAFDRFSFYTVLLRLPLALGLTISYAVYASSYVSLLED